MTRNQTPEHNTIPLEALVARVARAVVRFLEVRPSESSLASCPQTEILKAGSPRATLPASVLAGRQGWRHGKRRHPYRPHPSHSGQLAANPPAQSLHLPVISKRSVDSEVDAPFEKQKKKARSRPRESKISFWSSRYTVLVRSTVCCKPVAYYSLYVLLQFPLLIFFFLSPFQCALSTEPYVAPNLIMPFVIYIYTTAYIVTKNIPSQLHCFLA